MRSISHELSRRQFAFEEYFMEDRHGDIMFLRYGERVAIAFVPHSIVARSLKSDFVAVDRLRNHVGSNPDDATE